jgi:hypothetical protein
MKHIRQGLADGKRHVLYIGIGKYSHSKLPFKHIKNDNHVSVVMRFNDTGAESTETQATAGAWTDKDRTLTVSTHGGLPVDDAEEFYSDGSLTRLLDAVVTNGSGAAVLLFAEDEDPGSATTPAVFRYIHLANAVYGRMRTNEWSTVLDGKRGAHLRAVLMFGMPTPETAVLSYDLMFPTQHGCSRTYISNLESLVVSDNFDRLWFYVACASEEDPRVARCRQLAGASSSTSREYQAD